MFVDRRSLRPAHPVGVKCWVHLSPFLNRCDSTPTELAARRRSVLQTSNSSGVPSLLTWLEELGWQNVQTPVPSCAGPAHPDVCPLLLSQPQHVLQCFISRSRRLVFQPDKSLITCAGNRAEDIAVIDLAGAWLVTARNISDMKMRDLRYVLRYVRNDVAFHDLMMIDVKQHLERG